MNQTQDEDDPNRERPEEESEEQRLRRRNAEFNRALREKPWELQVWLDFAEFQDESARGGGSGRARRGVAAAVAERKIAILEQALVHHPGSQKLLLALLDTVWKHGRLLMCLWRLIRFARNGGELSLMVSGVLC